MTTFGIIPDPTVATFKSIQSADPVDLQTQVNAYLASLGSNLVMSIVLAGGGDGFMFVVDIESVPVTVLGGGGLIASGVAVRCFLAGTSEELARAKTAAGVPPPVSSIAYSALDEQLAGASKGQRFMGMTVFLYNSIPVLPGPLAITASSSPTAIPGGGAVDADLGAFAGAANGFAITAPKVLSYTSTAPAVVLIEASVTVELDVTHDFTVEIVSDPTGTDTVLASQVSNVEVSGKSTNVSVIGVCEIPLNGTKFGVRVTGAGGTGSIVSTLLRISRAP